jgi:YggT family protein
MLHPYDGSARFHLLVPRGFLHGDRKENGFLPPLLRMCGGIFLIRIKMRFFPMFVFGNFFVALAKITQVVLTLYMWILIARALLSWVNPDPHNPIVRFLHQVTDPVMDRVRRILPLQFGGIDFSPILIILAIVFLQEFLVTTLYNMGVMMGR